MVVERPTGIFNRLTNFFGVNTVAFDAENNKITDNPTVLVIDEADVFFNDQFYGRSYCPAIKLKDNSVAKLFELIWKMAKQP